MAASPICTIMGAQEGLESASMAASPICAIMCTGRAGKCIYGSVPHLYDNRGKEEIQMCQCPNVPMSKCTDVPKCHFW